MGMGMGEDTGSLPSKTITLTGLEEGLEQMQGGNPGKRGWYI